MIEESSEPFRIALNDDPVERWAFAPNSLESARKIIAQLIPPGTPYRLYEKGKLIQKGIAAPPSPKKPGKPGRPRKKKLTAAQSFKLRPWEFGIDVRTIPDDVFRSEVAR